MRETTTTMPSPATEAADVVKVGLLLPMSGAHAELGQSLYKAAELALFDIADEKFALVLRDTASTPEGAAQAAQEVIGEGVQLVLGPVFAADAQQVAPITGAAGVPVISFSTDSAVARPGVYVMGILPQLQVQRIVGYAGRQGIRTIGALVPANAYGQAVTTALQDAAPRAGVRVASVSTYDPAAPDKASEAAQLAGAGYDAVLIPEGGDAVRALAPPLSGTVQLLGSTLWEDPTLAGVPALQGGWFAAPAPERRLAFEQKYRSVHGSTPPRLATIVYDAVALGAALAKNHMPFTDQSLTQGSGFAGLDGIFRFRPDGQVERGLAVLEIRNGQIVTRDPAANSFDEVIF
jgi:ABC-type branched-subunit amino acid transport system substrate-binding protein